MKNLAPQMLLLALAIAFGTGFAACYRPIDSQEYFRKAAAKDLALEPIYSTAIYTVYFDYALGRCVLHSAHTWGQQGGGGGGTGIGVSSFPCVPNKIRERARAAGLEVYEPQFVIPGTAPQLGSRPYHGKPQRSP